MYKKRLLPRVILACYPTLAENAEKKVPVLLGDRPSGAYE